jgi:hypothetical protein
MHCQLLHVSTSSLRQVRQQSKHVTKQIILLLFTAARREYIQTWPGMSGPESLCITVGVCTE